jgi:hypothetical protein
MTGYCQPLDRRVVENLKARARRRFDQLCIDQNGDPTMQDSVAMMVDAWKSIGQDEILDAWDLQPVQPPLLILMQRLTQKEKCLEFAVDVP